MRNLKLAVALLALSSWLAQTPRLAGQSGSGGAAFDREWEGKTNEGGQERTTSFRLVSDGSVVMNVFAAGTPHEMITMFHMDGSDLLATHYLRCP
jgi:hypothetical protein